MIVVKILTEVLLKWLICTGFGDLYITKYLGDKYAMEKVSIGFVKRSNSVLKGRNWCN